MLNTSALELCDGGSPPRARGHGRTTRTESSRARFTPACAGTWVARLDQRTQPPVHPRVRGDMSWGKGRTDDDIGSPPRARGHDQLRVVVRVVDRFTPACAGTCSCRASAEPTGAVHPRVRGDMTARGTTRPASRGSPPRARGHARLRRPDARSGRFTPACAGTCAATAARRRAATVHPRVRGDMIVDALGMTLLDGSPPRARGHAVATTNAGIVGRFTPACAGTWDSECRLHSLRPVHPRVRGDMLLAEDHGDAVGGSPPRARGHGRTGSCVPRW